MDNERLIDLRRRIAEGSYHVDPDVLAEVVLATPGSLVLWRGKPAHRRRPRTGRGPSQVETPQGR
jgi:hypothetical protein